MCVCVLLVVVCFAAAALSLFCLFALVLKGTSLKLDFSLTNPECEFFISPTIDFNYKE